jgi:hypothetical protein
MPVKVLLLPVVLAASCWAAAPPIGIVTASGHFTVDDAEVWGNTTLFDGGSVETDAASSAVTLRNGVKIQFASASSARVRANQLTLRKGIGQVSASENYEVNAGGLSIRSAEGTARMRVGWAADGRIEVASLVGRTRVATERGLLLASIPAGRSMFFAFQAGGAASVTRAGCVLYRDGKYFMQDQNTQEVIELAGGDLGGNVGNRMNVTGTVSSARPALSIATSMMNVNSATTLGTGGCLSVAAALNAQTEVPRPVAAPTPAAGTPTSAPSPAPVAAKTGLSTGAKVGIAVAVVGGGAGAGIALAGGKKSTSP